MLLEVRNISVYYGKSLALESVSLSVPEGSVVSVIGQNGAGKSTLLRTISGLVRCSKGEIWFLGDRIDRKHPHEIVRLGLVHIPEGRWIFPYLSVRVNLLLGASARRDRRQVEKDLERVYELFPRLKEMEDEKAGALSGGLQQMLAIGRGLMAKPKLLLMDEPSLGLAPLVVKSLGDVIRALREEGISILLAEQNIPLALEVGDSLYALRTGRISFLGNARAYRSSEIVKMVYFS